jgi:hypothetical protein
MPLIPAGEHARLLAATLGSRTPVIDSTRCSLTAGKTTAAADDRWLAAAADVLREGCRPVRHFSRHPVSLAQVRTIVTSAYATERRDWPLTVHGDPKLVTRLRQGMHLVKPPGRGRLSALPDAAWLPELRREYADAPVLLHICGDLEAAGQIGGGSGYGALLVRAGALGHAAWLSAVSAGLAGATFGYASHRVTETARLAGRGLHHLMTVAIGMPSVTDHQGTEGMLHAKPQ